uniref:Uncharacterized protein n=1 Tax=Mantoniella antarctica TaxID=81844 RepID=A0A7S0X9E7_9CHLO|mmetsp:Transcript_24075/g.59729  ORF Transcript_24075/g.59729 Transcript_24075/m.59729 type:complete len:918 (+) Transcript_24075:2-2755(+)
MVCRQVCDPASQFRRSLSDISCTAKLTPGTYCNAYQPDECASGLCGGASSKFPTSRFCCDQAATTSNCSQGCESITGQCTNKSGPGETCNTSTDCFSEKACLNGKCCQFSQMDMSLSADPHGVTNCNSCDNSGMCSACGVGFKFEARYPHRWFHMPGTGGMVCRQQCDPATEYRKFSSDLVCTKKLAPGQSCYSIPSYNHHPDDTCQSGLCGGTPYMNEGNSYESNIVGSVGFCCDKAAAASNCSKGCEAISGACTAMSGAGERCQTSAQCYGERACLDGICCAFSTMELNDAVTNTACVSRYSSGQGFSNCTACGVGTGECSMCNTGYELEYKYTAFQLGPLVCRQICNPSKEFRWHEDDVFCSKIRSLPAGSRCRTSQSDSCESGLCSSGSSFDSFGNCCSEDAVSAKCSTGCMGTSSAPSRISSGECSMKSTVGALCKSSDDCYNNMACLGGVCCAFFNSAVLDDQGFSNCTACSPIDGECSSCKPGARLRSSTFLHADLLYTGFHAVTSKRKACFDICDPTSQFNAFNERNNHPECWKISSPGEACYGYWSYTNMTITHVDHSSCQTGHCASKMLGPGPYKAPQNEEGPYVCCNKAATQAGCTSCDLNTGTCATPNLLPIRAKASAKVTLEMSGASVEDGITDNELAAMIEMLREGSGLNSDYTSSVEAIYKLKSAIEMSSSMNLNSSDVRQAIAEAIASSSPTINDARDVMIIGTTVASVRRRHLTAEQSFRIDYEISLNRSQSANVNPKQTAADMRNAMSSPAFKEFLSKFGIEASVTYVAPTRIAVKLIITIEAVEGEDLTSSLEKMLEHALSPTFAEELEAKGMAVGDVKGTYALPIPPSPPSPPPLFVMFPPTTLVPLPEIKAPASQLLPPPSKFMADDDSSTINSFSGAFSLIALFCVATLYAAVGY